MQPYTITESYIYRKSGLLGIHEQEDLRIILSRKPAEGELGVREGEKPETKQKHMYLHYVGVSTTNGKNINITTGVGTEGDRQKQKPKTGPTGGRFCRYQRSRARAVSAFTNSFGNEPFLISSPRGLYSVDGGIALANGYCAVAVSATCTPFTLVWLTHKGEQACGGSVFECCERAYRRCGACYV